MERLEKSIKMSQLKFYMQVLSYNCIERTDKRLYDNKCLLIMPES